MSLFFAKLWQALVSGLSIGSIYALIAEGYYITFVTTGALNFGQGEFLMIGALFGLTCYVTFGLPYAVAVIAAVLLTGVMGAALERGAIRPVMRHALSLRSNFPPHSARPSSRSARRASSRRNCSSSSPRSARFSRCRCSCAARCSARR